MEDIKHHDDSKEPVVLINMQPKREEQTYTVDKDDDEKGVDEHQVVVLGMVLFVCSFACSFVRLFVRSFVRSFG